MCGITARVGTGDGVPEILTGLEKLEYRGYDSAGVAIKNGAGLEVYKRGGEISRLRAEIERNVSGGAVGIGHTRWSTHGPPTDRNAHPLTDCHGRIAVVHNGIIENYERLKADLVARGHTFESETDTEVIPHLVEERLDDGLAPAEAFRTAVRSLEGSYAVAMIVDGSEAVFATRQGSPLAAGVGDGTYYLSSDVPAFLEYTDRVIYLEDGDVVVVTPDHIEITDAGGRTVERDVDTVTWRPEDAEKGGYDHYMLKEIHEQPTAIQHAIQGRLDGDTGEGLLDELPRGVFDAGGSVQFVACGTSYHAAMYGSRLLADQGIPAQVFFAGEYATSPPPILDGTTVIGVTQSGETADTLESLRRANDAGARTVAVTNVVGSTAAREVDHALFVRAGPEIGVAATKTFSSQVALLSVLAEHVGRDVTGTASERWPTVRDGLYALPRHVRSVLDESAAEAVSLTYPDKEAYFFIGRGVGHAVALEGALKFKEITYGHAEGFPAGELKHGPLALVTPDTPVIAIFSGRHDEKTMNNVKEVQARGAPVVAVASADSTDVIAAADEALTFPPTCPEVAGVAANVQLQLLAYHVADLYDRPIDKPRNLAKCVTVE